MKFDSTTRETLAPALGIVVGVAAGLFPFAWHWDKLITRDWPYFLSLALVSRSNVLSYAQFPPHDPWTSGGTDILANPQSRLFSPTYLLELALPPYPAMLMILLVYGALGAWGMYKLLREFDVSKLVAVTAALFFINSSWFGLHFAEGHLAYPAFMLFPWLLYASKNIFEPRCQALMAGLFAFFLIDGSVYAFIFGLYLLPFLIIIDHRAWWRLIREWREHLARLAGLTIGAALITCAKVVPVMSIHASRPPELDQEILSFQELSYLLFYPLQDFGYRAGFRWGFHEYGCYIGIVALVAAIASLFRKENRLASSLYFGTSVLFLFTASGLGRSWDPWLLVHKIPFLNQAHVQSRLTVIFLLLFCVSVALGLKYLEGRKWLVVAVSAFLLIEALAVRTYPEWKAYEIQSAPHPQIGLLEGDEWKFTRRFGPQNRKTTRKLMLYEDPGVATLDVYEPTRKPTSVQTKSSPGYLGEAYPVDVVGRARIVSYEPGEVTVEYDLKQPGQVQVNTNELGGWVVESGAATMSDDPTTLLTFETSNKTGRATLVYSPGYLKPLTGLVPIGFVMFISISVMVYRREEADA